MDIRRSDIVRSLAGRDKDMLFFAVDVSNGYVLIADGKGRKIESPKRKKLKHLRLESQSSCTTAERLRSGENVSNNELRRALAEYAGSPKYKEV